MSSYANKDDKITAHYPAAGEAKSRKACERLDEEAVTRKRIRLRVTARLSISRITSRSGFAGTAGREPFEEVAERRPAVAPSGLFFCGQLGKCFLDLRKVEQRIVAEAIGAPRSVEDDSFGRAPKCGQSLAAASTQTNLAVR
jgi:hypothetical protein